MSIIRLPSVTGESIYDLFILPPSGLQKDRALEIINAEILRANQEDAESSEGGCLDGLSVEESIKRALEDKGFFFIEPIESICWDEDPPVKAGARPR